MSCSQTKYYKLLDVSFNNVGPIIINCNKIIAYSLWQKLSKFWWVAGNTAITVKMIPLPSNWWDLGWKKIWIFPMWLSRQWYITKGATWYTHHKHTKKQNSMIQTLWGINDGTFCRKLTAKSKTLWWNKAFKNGPSNIYGRHLKKLKWYCSNFLRAVFHKVRFWIHCFIYGIFIMLHYTCKSFVSFQYISLRLFLG